MVEFYEKYVKKITRVEGHPIVDVEFQNIPDFTDLFNVKNFNRKDYGQLVVEQGRMSLPESNASKEFTNFQREFYSVVDKITIDLIALDPISYPVMCELEGWYHRKVSMLNNRMVIPTLDQPGFNMPWHCDNRLIISSGIVNMQDHSVSTIFQKDNTGWVEEARTSNTDKLIHVAKKEKHTGTFWLNTNVMWHAVPKIQEERHILLINAWF